MGANASLPPVRKDRTITDYDFSVVVPSADKPAYQSLITDTLRNIPHDCSVEITFEKHLLNQTKTWSYSVFGERPNILTRSHENSYDYAIIDPPKNANLGPSLKFSDTKPSIGDKVCSLGYPFEHPHVTIHQGIISSIHDRGCAEMLKLDMSVNPSNSGGPLIDLSNGLVVGVVARKATGLSKIFDELLASYDHNINVFEQISAQGGISIMGQDPIRLMAMTQAQMKQVSLEVKRSANVGIGYAVWVEPLRDERSLS